MPLSVVSLSLIAVVRDVRIETFCFVGKAGGVEQVRHMLCWLGWSHKVDEKRAKPGERAEERQTNEAARHAESLAKLKKEIGLRYS